MAFYLRVDGVDRDDLTKEDAEEVTGTTYYELERRGYGVEGVVPYIAEDAHERLAQADTGGAHLDTEDAEVLLEAVETLSEDIGNGRTYGRDRDETRENANRLGTAREALRDELADE